LDETGLKTRSHGVSKDLIFAQGASLGIQNRFISASWQEYEKHFIDQLILLHSQGVRNAIFGDIDLLAHREWEELVCSKAGLTAVLPLWNEDRLAMVHEFLEAGFKARVVCVDGRFLDDSFVGVEFNQNFINQLPPNVDACGENGEFHTFVYDGPNVHHQVQWESLGKNTYTSPKEFGEQTYYFDLLGSPAS
jgi:uncharacterized protein (TIGR00290 family)